MGPARGVTDAVISMGAGVCLIRGTRGTPSFRITRNPASGTFHKGMVYQRQGGEYLLRGKDTGWVLQQLSLRFCSGICSPI